MRVQELIDTMEQIAPLKYAEAWDNVGLLVGNPQQEIISVMLCIDYTNAVAEEAKLMKCNTVIAYHPPIFSPLKRIIADHLIFDAIQQGIAIYSPHTALDSTHGGINDALADMLGLQNRTPLRFAPISNTYFKLVTLVPEQNIEPLSNALFAAGAGHIGNYSQCSFRTPGTGTFFGEEGTHPAVGICGKLEKVTEIRLEMIVPATRVHDVTAALYKHHPYEEPVYDLLHLTITPKMIGQGRVGTLPSAQSRKEVIERIKQGLGLNSVLVSGPIEGMITRSACLAGAGGEFLNDAIAQDAQLYLTGEIRHHDAIKAANANLTVVCTLHSNSERLILQSLIKQLSKKYPELKLHQSQCDHEPFKIL